MLKALMISLMQFAAPQMGVDAPRELPQVRYASACDMQRQYEGEAFKRCKGDGELRVGAFYEPSTRTMTLPKGFDPKDPGDQSILLHELVHHVQNLSGKDVVYYLSATCPVLKIELEAYRVQFRFLRLKGIDPAAFQGYTLEQLATRMGCDGQF